MKAAIKILSIEISCNNLFDDSQLCKAIQVMG